jgi:RHS repeat-associated protein
MRRSFCLSRRMLWILPVLGLLANRPILAQSGPPLTIRPSGTDAIQVTWPPGTNFNVLEEAFGLDGTNAWFDAPEAPSPLGLLYSVREATTNGATFYRLAQRGAPGVTTPPDPASVAPKLSPNVFNSVGSSTAFLYTGPNPIQVGVAPGTIQTVRAAVLRGAVLSGSNTPLPGVRVAILNHTEFGYTYTRTNGHFDLAVNASSYTVDFAAIGYCPAQRQVTVVNQGYTTLATLVMLPLDIVANSLVFGSNAPTQVAVSSIQSDAAGTRSATVAIPAGTLASLVLADGSTQAVTGLTLHVTEFTVGPNGAAAMPATLPPNSGYTYCADFSADEELALGSSTILFDKLVPVYVDNFLNVPVGTLVPGGEYERQLGVWVPLTNGIVIQILGQTNGQALIDLHGSGHPEPAGVLSSNGFTSEELQSLANLYPAGKSIWRTLTARFCAVDFNFGKGVPDGSKPNIPGDKPKGDPNDKSPENYGTLNFSQQTFTESIPLQGAPFYLNYNSARLPDYKVNNFLTIPIQWIAPTQSCPQVEFDCALPSNYFDPPSVMLVEVDIAGEQSLQTYPISNSFATVSWDGLDAYGRYVGGSYLSHITVAYEFTNWDYFGICCGPEYLAQFPSLFGNDGNVTSFQGHVGNNLAVGSQFSSVLTIPDERGLGLGGWSPTCLHRLDPVSGTLYYGDGRIEQAWPENVQTDFVSQIADVYVCASAPDGTIYFYAASTNTSDGYFFCKRSPSGVYQFVSPVGQTSVPGMVFPIYSDWSQMDGKPASLVNFGQGVYPVDMCVGQDGSLYIMNTYFIARLTPDGIWHVLNGLQAVVDEMPPDGASAQQTFIYPNRPCSMAVGPDGSVYFSGGFSPTNGANYTVIRKIGTDGLLYTVFGAGGVATGQTSSTWPSLFGQAAFGVHYYGDGAFASMVVGADGSIYVAPRLDASGIFRISPGGIVQPFLNLDPILEDDGRSVTNAVNSGALGPYIVRLGPDGTVYFDADSGNLWQVDQNSVLHHVAGWGGSGPAPDIAGDNGDPLDTLIYIVTDFSITPDNGLVVDFYNTIQQVPFVIFPPRPSLVGLPPVVNLQNIPSDDGSEVYVFDQQGIHLQTLDSLTGGIKWTFGYNTNSQISTITDGAGLTTTITRDGSGNATAIVGPYGQTTALQLDANGFLASVTNPGNETTVLNNSIGGLLTSITGPLGDTYNVSYNSLGQVTQVRDPLGGGWTDTTTESAPLTNLNYEVNVACTNSVGDTQLRYMSLQPTGTTTVSYYAGTNFTESESVAIDGGKTFSFSDGSSFYSVVGADPRFGSQVQNPNSLTLNISPTLTQTTSIQRSTTLAQNGNPLSFTALTNLTTVNGNTSTQVYTASNRTFVVTSPAGRSMTFSGDSLGRVIHTAAAGQGTVDFTYNANGQLVAITNTSSAGPAVITFAYNSLGQASAITEPLGNTVSFAYSAAGRMKQLTMPDGSVAGLIFDSEGNLTSVTPPGRPAHTYEYNSLGSLTNYTPPLVASNESITLQYDTERNLTRATAPDGQTETFVWGPNNQLQQYTLGAGATLTYQYGANPGASFLCPLAINSSTGENVQFGYTASIRTSNAWSGPISGQFSAQPNNDFLASSRTVGNSTVSYTYDPDLLMTQAGNLAITRDPASGNITATTLGSVTDQRMFDDRGLMTNYSVFSNAVPVWSMGLAYDLDRRLTNKVESFAAQVNTFGYVYDRLSRLQQVWLNGSLDVAYSYDTNGNRLTRNTETATYDAQDRVLTYAGTNFAWSPNGYMLTATAAGETTTYSYDIRGVILSVTLPSGAQIGYILDPMGHRVGKQIGGILQRGWLWDGLVPVAQVDSNSDLTASFVYGADGTAPSYMITPTNTYRIITDERGSVRLVINSDDGSVAQQMEYDEFGRVLLDTAPGFQPFGYAGGLYDPDTALVHFGARDYSPQLGRWLQRDPINIGGGDFAMYNYVNNDPINRADINGCGPMQKLRQQALSGDPRALQAYQNLLRAKLNIDTGIADDALKSAQAYGKATKVSKAGIAILGTLSGVSSVANGVLVIDAAGGAALQTAGGMTLIVNGLFTTGASTAQAVSQGVAPANTLPNDIPTSIAQVTLPPNTATVVDIALGRGLPSPAKGTTANLPQYLQSGTVSDQAAEAAAAIATQTEDGQ